ncbi:MAG: MFS transporter [Myxococcota bacterium]
MTWPLVIILVANFAHWLSFVLLLHLPAQLAARGTDPTEIGLVMGVMALTAVAVRPTVGRWLDVYGRRPVLLVGGALNIGACLSYQLSDLVYLSRALHGVAQGTLFAALFATAADIVSGTQRSRGLGLFTLAGMLPLLLVGPVGDTAIAWHGFSALFIVAALAAFLGSLVCLALREPPRPSFGPTGTTGPPGEPRGSFYAPLRRRELRPLLFAIFLAAFAIASYFTFMKNFLAERALGSMTLFFAPYTAAGIVLRVFFAELPNRLGAKRVLFGGFASMIAGLLTLCGASTPASVVAAALLCGIAHGYVFLVLAGLLVNRTRHDQRGRSLAVFTALFDAGMLVGAVGLGTVVDAIGHPAMFGATALVVGLGVVLFGLWDREARIVLLAPTDEQSTRILRALKATGASVCRVDDATQLAKQLATQLATQPAKQSRARSRGIDLVVADRRLVTDPLVPAGAGGPRCLLYSTSSSSSSSSSSSPLGAPPNARRGLTPGGSTGIVNFLAGAPQLASDELFATVTKLLSDDIFGLEKYFAWGSPTIACSVHGPNQRDAAIDTVLGFATAQGVHERWSRPIASVVDEWLINALGAGPNTQSLFVPIEVQASYDGRRFGIRVSDPFGRFDPESASRFITAWFQHQQPRLPPQERGIGLHHATSCLSHLVINLAPGQRTEMIGLLDVRTSYRGFVGKTKSMNIFVQPAQPAQPAQTAQTEDRDGDGDGDGDGRRT